jgi:hypothetical protein
LFDGLNFAALQGKALFNSFTGRPRRKRSRNIFQRELRLKTID